VLKSVEPKELSQPLFSFSRISLYSLAPALSSALTSQSNLYFGLFLIDVTGLLIAFITKRASLRSSFVASGSMNISNESSIQKSKLASDQLTTTDASRTQTEYLSELETS